MLCHEKKQHVQDPVHVCPQYVNTDDSPASTSETTFNWLTIPKPRLILKNWIRHPIGLNSPASEKQRKEGINS